MRDLSLNGTWRVRSMPFACEGERGYRRTMCERKGWIPARVPGEVHLDLMRAGLMDEPLVSDNAPRCRWPETKSWWFRRAFTVRPGLLRHERLRLVFDGLDCNAQVFLNGRLLGTSQNAFVPAVFDLKRHPMDRDPRLRPGRNELVVRLTAGSELAQNDQFNTVPKPGAIPNPFDPKAPQAHRGWPARRWLRKPQCAYGWDWVEALPNIGIWRGVRLEGHSHVVLADLRVDSINEGGRWFVECEAVAENLHPWSERACTLEFRLKSPGGGKTVVRRIPLALPPGQVPVRFRIHVVDPQLWWPNGMGAQPLYQVTARILDGRVECDRRAFDTGLRTIALARPPSPGGSRFVITVNGKEVFCRGGNWVPADAILARLTPAKYRTLVAEAREANMNMLRVWGGGIYEDPAFYDACDRSGILVWQDFMFACTTYHDHLPEFRAAIRSEAEAMVKALRHHASIALWSGNNENIWSFCDWINNDPAKPVELGGSILYNQVLPDVLRLHDPRRPYWPSSPCGGPKPNSETSGDCHWWFPTSKADPESPIRHETFDICRARFVSEYGLVGPLSMRSVRQCLKPRERRLDAPAWKMHTNGFANSTLAPGIRRHYAEPDGLPLASYVRYGQMVQAFLYEKSIEALRFRKHDPRDDCMGALIWMFNDCWPEHGWTLVDYYLRRKPSFYGFKRAGAPVKAIVRVRGRDLVTRVLNDTLEPVAGRVEYGWFRLDGTARRTRTRPIRVAADGMAEVARERLPPRSQLDPREWLYAALLETETFRDQCVYPLLPYRQLAWSAPDVRVRLRGRQAEFSSPVFCHGVYVEDDGRPLLDDNYFDLLPGVSRVVGLRRPVRAAGLKARVVRVVRLREAD